MLTISNKKRNFVRSTHIFPEDTSIVVRPSQHYFRVLKAGISDGVSSATGIYDDVEGHVPDIFNPRLDRLDLADALMRAGAGSPTASDVASKGIESQL